MNPQFTDRADYAAVTAYIDRIAGMSRFARVKTLGESLLGRKIQCIYIGNGPKISLFVGAFHALESITSMLLLRLCDELVTARAAKSTWCGYDSCQITDGHTVIVIPQLNPDGVELHFHGRKSIPETGKYALDLPTPDPADYSRWQANARGVDLNHNFDAGFDICRKLEASNGINGPGNTRYSGEYPESEPEVRALCNLTKELAPKLRIVLAMHTQGEEIYWNYQNKAPAAAYVMGRHFERVTGYKLSEPEGMASYGGYKDWIIDKFGIPAFTVECGKGENPLPPSDAPEIYKKIRPLLLASAIY